VAAKEFDEDVMQAARYSLAQGVAWMKQRAEADPDGWIVGPNRVRKVIGTTNVTYTYSKRMVWQPVYSYTNVVTFVQETAGAPLKKVMVPRAVKIIGSNSVEQLVGDRNGTIEIVQAQPIYDRSGNIFWASRSIGDAALAAYALRKAGVPATDPVYEKVLVNLQSHIRDYGLPDQTWNLAWLTAVFAGVPGEKAANITQRLASRLLDGQITDGSARGMWGTISINHSLVAVLLRDYLEMMADFQRKELRLKQKPTKQVQAAVDELREYMDGFKTMTESEVCQRGFKFGGVESSWNYDPQGDPLVMLAGADHQFFNQTVADMESTWVALFALSVAADHGRLPSQSLRPKVDRKPGAPSFPLPERSEAVLARAVNALKAQQSTNGCWSECNQHQPVTKFDTFKNMLPVPSDPRSFVPLKSPVTALSAVQGITSFDYIGKMVGMKRLMNSLKAPYLAGLTGAQKEIDARLKAVWPVPTVVPRFGKDDYDLYLAMAKPMAGIEEAGAEKPDTEKMVRALVMAANPTGTWGKGLNIWTVPSSARARYAALKDVKVEMNQAHIFPAHAMWADISPLQWDFEGVSTAIAVLYLAGIMPDPAMVLAEFASQTELNELRQSAVKQLMIKKAVQPVVAPAPAAVVAPSPAGAAGAATAGAPVVAPKVAPKDAAPVTAPKEEDDIPDLPAAPVDTRPKADETF
jgi:hypothetical protein